MIQNVDVDRSEDEARPAPPDSSGQTPPTTGPRPRSKSMPVPLIIVLVLLGGILLWDVGGVITALMRNPAGVEAQAKPTAIRALMFIGLIFRNKIAKTLTIILAYFPLVTSIIDSVKVATGSLEIPPEGMGSFIASTTFQFLSSLAIIILLSLRSVRDYFNES